MAPCLAPFGVLLQKARARCPRSIFPVLHNFIFAHVAQLDSSDRLLSDRSEVRILSWVPKSADNQMITGVFCYYLFTFHVHELGCQNAVAISWLAYLFKQLLQLFRCSLVRAFQKVTVYVRRGAGSRVSRSAGDSHERDACCEEHRDIRMPQ